MRKLILIAFILLNFAHFAQLLLPFRTISKDSSFIQIYTNSFLDVHASSLTNEFSSKLLLGGHLYEDLISNTSKKQRINNRLGYILNTNLGFIVKPKKWNAQHGLTFSYAYNQILGGQYTPDVFELTMKGNQSFIGDTAILGISSYHFTTFQTLNFGYFNQKHDFHIELGLVLSNAFSEGKINSATIYFESDTSSIVTDYDFKLNNKLYTSTNTGFVIHFKKNFIVNLFNKNQEFQFSVNNLGIVNYSSMNTIQAKNKLSFSGFNLASFTNFSSEMIEDTIGLTIDTIQNSYRLLPFQIHFSKLCDISVSKLQWYYGLVLYPSISFNPKLFLGFHTPIKNNFFGGMNVSYGGFGGIRVGNYFAFNKQRISFALASDDMIGLISKKGFGKNLTLQLRCTF